jgi:DNA uptake protein ComE-like DNA-binding protein
MQYNARNWMEWFEFTSAELRALRLLLVLFALAVALRFYVMLWMPPPVYAQHLPWPQLSALMEEDSASTQRSDYYGQNTRWPAASWMNRKSSFHSASDTTVEPRFRKSRIVELNTADTIDLRNLPAIGAWLARKIVDYRQRLGGFVEVEQLLEVYRMTPGKLDTIRPLLVLDTSEVVRMDANTVELDRLLKHPYFSVTQAKGFINYRNKHGPFRRVEDLRKCLLIDENTYMKIREYMEVR